MKLLKKIKIALLVPYAFLLLLHFVIKDRSYDLAMLFNISPVPILIGIGVLLSLIMIPYKKWWRITSGVTLLLIFHWFYSYYGFKEVPVSKDNDHILLWNIDNRRTLPKEAFHEHMKTYEPEIVALLETRYLPMSEIKDLKEHYPEYDHRILRGYFYLAIKGEIESMAYKKYDSITKHHVITARIAGKRRTMMLADVGVVKHYNRWQDLAPILEVGLANEANMIFGDFNTPYESMHFDPFKEHYQSFHDVSEGFAATWPRNWPLLELDQIWVDPGIEPVSLKKFYYEGFSNHDMLIGSFKFKD